MAGDFCNCNSLAASNQFQTFCHTLPTDTYTISHTYNRTVKGLIPQITPCRYTMEPVSRNYIFKIVSNKFWQVNPIRNRKKKKRKELPIQCKNQSEFPREEKIVLISSVLVSDDRAKRGANPSPVSAQASSARWSKGQPCRCHAQPLKQGPRGGREPGQ